ncbi:gefF [Symbiodinium sp. CCMP2592]|nr:gefF [Symbiodinium sp. CCMP2592]
MLVFGGESGAALGDLVRCSLSHEVWSVAAAGPAPRSWHSAVWDRVTRSMLVFAGWSGSAYLQDLHVYDSCADMWWELLPAGSPSPRARHVAAWQPGAMSMLVFAGVQNVSGNLSYDGKLYRFDLLANAWAELATTIGPSPRADPRGVWDEASRALMTFGGFSAAYFDDLWRFPSTQRAQIVAKWPAGQDCIFVMDEPLPGVQISLKRSCLDSESLASAVTSDGQTFTLTDDHTGSRRLHVEPGWYRLCSCFRNVSRCDQPSDFTSVLGFFISEGPYANQTLHCFMGQPCAFASWRGVGLSANDSVIAMSQCGSSNASVTFGQQSAVLRIDRSIDGFTVELEQPALNGVPRTLQLCWCPQGRPCASSQDYQSVAFQLQVHCAPGQHEFEGLCMNCPEDSFCPDGQRVESCPAGSTAMAGSSDFWNCSCEAGYYMQETTCRACPYGSTTSQAGAVASGYCACAPGFINTSSSPSQCGPCGFGSFCMGGTHREKCGESRSTLVDVASDRSQCLCAAGTFLLDELCTPCAAGKYKSGIGNLQCSKCTAGTWSAAIGATSDEACQACPSGSTTENPGSWMEDLCIRPHRDQQFRCTSGKACSVPLGGFHLRDGHRLALTMSEDCGGAKLPVAGIASDGTSKPASGEENLYTWGDVPADFLPEGGTYRLCWCANMAGLVCASLESFQLFAGLLEVAGPLSDQLFQCVRGQDCVGLEPFRGVGLSTLDRLSLRTGGCGGLAVMQISLANAEGIASLEPAVFGESDFSLHFDFGTSDAELGLDHSLLVDASEAGYDLCWCGASENDIPSGTCSQPPAFLVPAGKLQIEGPGANQEIICSVGQPCTLSIRSVHAAQGDRIMVLSACGVDSAVQGFPGRGIAVYAEDRAMFQFQGESNLLLSPAGIYRLCFCRPTAEEECETATAFRAPVGLMTASGPFRQTSTCSVGSNCTLELSGIYLQEGDAMIVTEGTCDNSAGNIRDFMSLKQPFYFQRNGKALQVSMGKLPKSTVAGNYMLCWCPRLHACTSTSSFRAAAGQLQIDCPQGHFFTASRCAACGRGFYCPGGRRGSATRFPCPEHETTRQRNASAASDCECMAGYFLDSGSCNACDRGFYKADVGNAFRCNACPQNLTTLLSGSVSNSSCTPTAGPPSAEEGGSSMVDLNKAVGFSNVSDVATMTFNISVGRDWIDPAIRRELIATLRRSITDSTRMDPGAVEIVLPWADAAGRRLSALPSVGIVLKFPSAAEANLSAQETDVSVLVSDMSDAVRLNDDLSDFIIEATSTPEVSSVTITCPEFSAKPPGVPIVSASDCLCLRGYGFDAQFGTCGRCPQGEYKSSLADTECDKCETPKSTVQRGAISVHECVCAAGLYDHEGDCRICEIGYYCNGSGVALPCPANSTTISEGSRSLSECLCEAGYEADRDAERCEPCPSGRYKPSLGNEVCSLTCPANADSSRGSTEVDACYCLPGHVAETDNKGQLQRCASCALYSGLVCPGDFDEGTRNHTQPRSIAGWFQTGSTLAVQCHVVLPNGDSACSGLSPECKRDPTLAACGKAVGNQCAEGSSGMMCGECPDGWGRGSPLEYCQPCPQDEGAWLLAAAVLADLTRITVLNFVLTVLAAKGSGSSLKLHTCMIRMMQAWIGACQILLTFDLDRLQPFSWSQEEAHVSCDGECTEILRFAWPQAVSDAMHGVFSMIAVIPRASVHFAAECQSETWSSDKGMKWSAPVLYYLCLPVLSLLGTLFLSALVVYAVLPLGRMFGIHFNEADRRKAKKQAALKAVRGQLNLMKQGEGTESARGRGRILQELPQGLWDEVHLEKVPDVVLAGGIQDDQLFATASDGLISEKALRRLVLGVLAWKMRGELEAEAEREGLSKADFVVEVAGVAESVDELVNLRGESGRSLLRRACRHLRLRESELVAEVQGRAARLDLALFSSWPRPMALLKQSVPVIWLTQLALWPELMSQFLQMVRCISVREDRQGPVMVQRLHAHPDVVCWQEEHWTLFAIGVSGLVLWCFGIPLALFLRIWALTDRQEPENRRLFGYFIEGLEPRYWELVVKRLDIGLMLLIASTSVTTDDKAKLLLFALNSGIQLAVTAWLKPYSNSQAEILDFLECLLLGARFVLFTTVAVLLIFFPPAESMWAWSVSLLVMLVSVIVYAVLHIIGQTLRNAAGQLGGKPKMGEERKIVLCHSLASRSGFLNFDGAGPLTKLKQSVVALLLPLFQPESYLAFHWSITAESPNIITRRSQIQVPRYLSDRSWLLTKLAKASALLLRLSVGFQKEAVSKAYQDFVQLWLSDFDGLNIPNVSVLCALAVACRALPDNLSNSLICSFWKREIKKLAAQASSSLRVCFFFGVMGGIGAAKNRGLKQD